MRKSMVARLAPLLGLIAFTGQPLSAADTALGDDKKSGKLVIRRIFEDLSDKARTSLRGMEDECLGKTAALPKAAKTEWCLDQLERKYPMRQNTAFNQENMIRMYNDQLAQCPNTTAPMPPINTQDSGLTKEQKIQQCQNRINSQIISYKANLKNQETMSQNEKEQCKTNPDAALETKCRAFEDAFRNFIDRQLND